MMCPKCSKITGVLILLAGIGLLLVDLDMWSFYGIQWYTLAFLIVGVTGCAKCVCKDCMKKK